MTTTIIYIGSFLALLGVLVTIHEYGHFIFARIFNVHVQRFSIGMGPVIYKRLDKHGTEFAISALPLGGYVSMITNKLIEHEPEIKEKLTEEQIKKFKNSSNIEIGINHSEYSHTTKLGDTTIKSLSADFS